MLLGRLKDILRIRKDLKVIIMSATLEAAIFETFFTTAGIHNIPGRAFQVEVFHIVGDTPAAGVADYVVAAIKIVRHILQEYRDGGDIQVFMPGVPDIIKVISGLSHGWSENIILPLPLYKKLPEAQKQMAIKLSPDGRRKCVVSTNIAETSLTVDGVEFVVVREPPL